MKDARVIVTLIIFLCCIALLSTSCVKNDDGTNIGNNSRKNLKDEPSQGPIITTQPLIKDGLVYIGCRDGKFYVLDAETGATKWSFQADGQIMKRASYSSGKVYFTTKHRKLYSLSVNDGSIEWIGETSDAPFSAPFIDGENIYITTNVAEKYASIESFNIETGQKAWSMTCEEGFQNPHYCNGIVMVEIDCHSLCGINGRSGQELWRTGISHPLFIGTTENSICYIDLSGEGNYVCALDIDSGRELWRISAERIDAIGIANRRLICRDNLDSTKPFKIFALNISDGTEIWVDEYNSEFSDFEGWQPEIFNNSILCFRSSGRDFSYLNLIDTTTGRIVNKMHVDPTCCPVVNTNLMPTIDGNTVYFISHTFDEKKQNPYTFISAIDPEGERLMWQYRAEGFAAEGKEEKAPQVEQGALYLVTNNKDCGFLYCLDAATGELRWRFDCPTE